MNKLQAAIPYKLQKFFKTSFFRHGLPFILLVVGASYLTTDFQAARYEAKKRMHHNELLSGSGYVKTSLKEEYEKIKEIDTSDYKNIRGPRPWEDNKEWLNNRKLQEQRLREIQEKAAAKRSTQQNSEPTSS